MKTEHFIGRQADGTRVFVKIELREENLLNRMSIEHLPVNGQTTVASFTGFTIEKGRRPGGSAGQIVGEVYLVTEPAPGWTEKDITEIGALWIAWHLNDMQVDCVHGGQCPMGYQSGSAWLVQEIPQDALKKIRTLQSLPTGKVPSTY